MDTADHVDADGDGYSPYLGGCHDEDPSIHPGATETCDGVDEDCDGIVDDGDALGALTWHEDADGYGRTDDVVKAFEQPEGHVSDRT